MEKLARDVAVFVRNIVLLLWKRIAAENAEAYEPHWRCRIRSIRGIEQPSTAREQSCQWLLSAAQPIRCVAILFAAISS